MQMAELTYVSEGTPKSQRVVVMDEPGLLSMRWALIPEVRVVMDAAEPHGHGLVAIVSVFPMHRPRSAARPARDPREGPL